MQSRYRLSLPLLVVCSLISSIAATADAQELVVATGRATHLRPEIAVAPGTGNVLVTWLRRTEGPAQLVGRLLKRLPSGEYRRRRLVEISTRGVEASTQSVFWLPHTREFGVAYGEGGDSMIARVNANGGDLRAERYPIISGRASPQVVVRSNQGKRVFVFAGSAAVEEPGAEPASSIGWTWHTKQLARRGSGVLNLSEEFDEPVTLDVVGMIQLERHEYVVLANYFGSSQGVIAVRVEFTLRPDQFAIVATNKLEGQLPFTRLNDRQAGRVDGTIPVSGATAGGYIAALLDPDTLSLTNTIEAGLSAHSGLALLYTGADTDVARVAAPTLVEALTSGPVLASQLDLSLAPTGTSDIVFDHGGALTDMTIADLDLDAEGPDVVSVWTFQGGAELRAQLSTLATTPAEQSRR